jgi:hypothetical protein
MRKGVDPKLIDLLQEELARMTPGELIVFRRQLAEDLPEFIQETARRAKERKLRRVRKVAQDCD